MNHRIRLLILLDLVLLLVLPLAQLPSSAQSEDYLYFSETNHSVQGEFLEKFSSVKDPLLVFGYPITEQFIAPSDSPFAGKRVQYFQRAVFVFHLDNAPGHRVQLAPLGSQMVTLAQLTPLESLSGNRSTCETIPGSSYPVCYAFRQFFDDNGGVSVFGVPITALVLENNRMVQYFEYARFEWRPDLAPGQRVHLTNLGEIYFNANEDPSIKALGPDLEGLSIQSLQVRAFPLRAVASNQDTQTIYVVVRDQRNQAVAGAQVSLKVTLPNGQSFVLPMERTDSHGLTSASFAHQGEPIGRVQVLVEVQYEDLTAKTVWLSYRIW